MDRAGSSGWCYKRVGFTTDLLCEGLHLSVL